MKKFIMYTDVPRWYHLFWDRKTRRLCISIHKYFLEKCEFKNFDPYFTNLYDEASYLPLFDRYEAKLGQKSFGINDSITLLKEDDQWMTYKIKIPKVTRKTIFACTICGGTGRKQPEHIYYEKCSWCKGKKTEKILQYIEVGEVCYSLSVLLGVVQFPIQSGDTNSPFKQLFTITSCCETGFHGHSVGGYASPELLRFLESLSQSYKNSVALNSVKKVMKNVHGMMHGYVSKHDRFLCFTRRGQIILDCPGNACQIHTEPDRDFGSGIGDNITCHNLDTGEQQLMLLAGMAEISSLYDEWLCSNPKRCACRARFAL